MSHGIDIEWHDEHTAEIVNGSGIRLRHVRVQAVGETRIAGRPTWTVDREDWPPGATIRLVHVEPRGSAPQLRMRFRIVGSDDNLYDLSPWRVDILPLTPPTDPILAEDPWSLGARVERARRSGA